MVMSIDDFMQIYMHQMIFMIAYPRHLDKYLTKIGQSAEYKCGNDGHVLLLIYCIVMLIEKVSYELRKHIPVFLYVVIRFSSHLKQVNMI